MFDHIKSDVDCVLSRDPAATGRLEVLLCYPCIKALIYHRMAHKAYKKKHFLWARILSARGKKKTGIEIHPGAQIGECLFIDHGSGVVIGETAVIGKGVTLYQGVTLGGTGKDVGKRHPTVLDHVTIGAGAKVLGPITLGNHVKVGAGAIVLKDVPDECTVVGNPGRIVRRPKVAPEVDLEHGNLPDPMLERVETLETTLKTYEHQIKGCDACDVVNCPNHKDSQTTKNKE